jgi:maltose alpha-D-glucosyltransferase/alpha-amylase
LELTSYLQKSIRSTAMTTIVGHVEWRQLGKKPINLAVLHQYLPNQGTAWGMALQEISQFFETMAALSVEEQQACPPRGPLVQALQRDHDINAWREPMSHFWSWARHLGVKLGQLHNDLAQATAPELAPEPFTTTYLRSIYQGMRNQTELLLQRLKAEQDRLPFSLREPARQMLGMKSQLLDRFKQVLNADITGQRIRIHGDYHLGQLLFTGQDVVLIDFEGDTSKSIGERRIKRSPLRDVVTLLRSFDYATQVVMHNLVDQHARVPGIHREQDWPVLETWAEALTNTMAHELLQAYRAVPGIAPLLPDQERGLLMLLECLLLEKALDEAHYDLTSRPEWAFIPVAFILQQLGTGNA